MSLAPEIAAFGDANHLEGETNITLDGGGFGAFPGSVWVYAGADRSGAADQLTVVSWNDLQIVVDIPANPNNAPGAAFVFVQREDLAWSNAYAFTLVSASGPIVVGQAQETDSVSAAVVRKTLTVGLTAETALPLGIAVRRKTLTVGPVVELNLALNPQGVITVPVGLTTETDAALAATHGKAVTVGQTSETAVLFGLTHNKLLAVGLVTEADVALALSFEFRIPPPWRRVSAISAGNRVVEVVV